MEKYEFTNIFDYLNKGCKKVCSISRGGVLTTNIQVDDFTNSLKDYFDFDFNGVSKFQQFETNDIIKNLDFEILCIVGASGSGKTTFAKNFGEMQQITWDNTKAIISHFKTPKEAIEKLNACGLSSVPTWCKPRNVLSIGEGFRADLARQLNDNCIIDEFTSNVDRNVALSCANSIGKYIRKNHLKKCVFISCHKDFIDTLLPDYVIDLDEECVYDTRGLERRQFNLQMYVGENKRRTWNIFGKHHYMSQDINLASTLYTLYFNKDIVGCCYILPIFNGFIQNGWRIHRLVIKPDYQGLGFGTRFLETICNLYTYYNAKMYIRTSHEKLRQYFEKHVELWQPTKRNGTNDYHVGGKMWVCKNAIAYSYKYIGQFKIDNIDYTKVDIYQNQKVKTKQNYEIQTLL